MAGRSEARRFVLQMLYLLDHNPEADRDRIASQLSKEFKDAAVQSFAWSLITGILDHQPQLDEKIAATATNWRLERMAPTDRNVLRMGLYEMTVTGTPPAVVIDEAVTIAREFGTENSGAFVNGILDRLIPAGKSISDGPPVA
ncbi:MAG: transcription antitermination factor NusB [Planctomycetaceae bacterium]|nr:transcription antitermination factor NusB [Planctomycetaceae bacterium]